MTEPGLGAAYLGLIHSERTSAHTRAALLERAKPVAPDYSPMALTAAELTLLRAVAGRVLPQAPGDAIDLGARLDHALATGTGDGWRFAILPEDRTAYRVGLAVLEAVAQAGHGRGFAELDAAAQDAILTRAASGDMVGPGEWTGQQVQRWFEDLRAEAVKLYVAHPHTLARIGYSGPFYGGDGERLPGFHQLEPGVAEAWEPSGDADPGA